VNIMESENVTQEGAELAASPGSAASSVRWRSMKSRPRGKESNMYMRGDDGETYIGYFAGGRIFTHAPGWVTFTGWRKSSPNDKITDSYRQ